jgi:endonuclease YncB( thermonuclease family)
VDIQAEMVKAGMAWAFIRYSHDYVVQEGEAQAANRKVHAHE